MTSVRGSHLTDFWSKPLSQEGQAATVTYRGDRQRQGEGEYVGHIREIIDFTWFIRTNNTWEQILYVFQFLFRI